MNRSLPPDALAAALTALSHGLEVTDPALSPSSNATAPTSPLTPRENEFCGFWAKACPIKLSLLN